jgi:hypothetical protein
MPTVIANTNPRIRSAKLHRAAFAALQLRRNHDLKA